VTQVQYPGLAFDIVIWSPSWTGGFPPTQTPNIGANEKDL